MNLATLIITQQTRMLHCTKKKKFQNQFHQRKAGLSIWWVLHVLSTNFSGIFSPEVQL